MSNDQLHNTAGANLSVSDVSLDVAGVAALGAPVVGSVIGTFAQGNTLTVSGSNFSTNSSSQLLYEDFENGVSGSVIDNIAGFDQGATRTTNEHQYKYTDEDKFTGTKCAKLDFIVGGADGFRPQFDLGENKKVFVHMRMKVHVIAQGLDSADSQIKLNRISSVMGSHTAHPHFGITYQGGVTPISDDGEIDKLFYGATLNGDEWISFLGYFDVGTLGNYDGSKFIKTHKSDNFTHSTLPGEEYSSVSNDGTHGLGASPHDWKPKNNVKNLSANIDGEFLRCLLIPFYKRPADSYTIYVDQVWANSSLESVFVSPFDTWEEAKVAINDLVIQPMASRDSDSITITCEEGHLNGLKYIYVVNEDGSANATGMAAQ